MVGVAGKSKACHDCKRRRVKCGFERPGCLRCIRARIQCSGYDHQLIYVNKTLANPSTSATDVLVKRSFNRAASRPIQYELDRLVDLAKSTTSPSHSRLEAFKMLQKLYLPQPEVADQNPGHAAPIRWFKGVCELQDVCPVLDHALIAFCSTQVYITKTGEVSLDDCMGRYNAALAGLSSGLNHDDGERLNYVLASIVVLSTCELFLFPTDDGLRIHVQGITDVLRLKQAPQDVSKMIWPSIYSRLRVISTITQLTCRHQSFVSAAQWAELMGHNATTDTLDQVMEFACELPQALDYANEIFSQEHLHDSAVHAHVIPLWNILRKLLDWQADINVSTSTPLYTAVPSKLTNPADANYDSKLFPFALEFRSLQTATYCAVSWAFQLHTLAVFQRLIEQRGESAIVPPAFVYLYNQFESIKTACDKLARYLCQSVEYCHRLEMGTFGPQTLTYPQWILRQYMARYGTEREEQWCNSVLDMTGPGTQCGIRLMRFQGTVHCLQPEEPGP